jgi:hypothetical protein
MLGFLTLLGPYKYLIIGGAVIALLFSLWVWHKRQVTDAVERATIAERIRNAEEIKVKVEEATRAALEELETEKGRNEELRSELVLKKEELVFMEQRHKTEFQQGLRGIRNEIKRKSFTAATIPATELDAAIRSQLARLDELDRGGATEDTVSPP